MLPEYQQAAIGAASAGVPQQLYSSLNPDSEAPRGRLATQFASA